MKRTVDMPTVQKKLTREQVSSELEKNQIRFLQLHFVDILGIDKIVEVPSSQFEKALDGNVMFDGSSIDGFVRIEESDMMLNPDFDTFRVLPWDDGQGKVARLICEVLEPDGTMFEGCSRGRLRKQIEDIRSSGFAMMIGPEAEFFLFQKKEDGTISTITNDEAGYFDAAPLDQAVECRRKIANVLEKLQIDVEASHHEVAPGQHEIDFRYGNALQTADNLMTFKYVVKKTAQEYGLHATFMPKPLTGVNGSGMHLHISLFDPAEQQNYFFDKNSTYQLSKYATLFIAGIIEHAPSICAITNPLVNSYKRLQPGYEAPTHMAWSLRNRSPMIRIPERRGLGTRIELRMPDPSCNPYLAFSCVLAAGMDGIIKNFECPPPIPTNLYEMSEAELANLNIRQLPGSLEKAIETLEMNDVLGVALGHHIMKYYILMKRAEWKAYSSQVHLWESQKYFRKY